MNFQDLQLKKRPISVSDSHTRISWWRANNRLNKECAAESVRSETGVKAWPYFPSMKYLIRVLAAQGMHDPLLPRNSSLLRIPTPPARRLLPDARWDRRKGETLEKILHERPCIGHLKMKTDLLVLLVVVDSLMQKAFTYNILSSESSALGNTLYMLPSSTTT